MSLSLLKNTCTLLVKKAIGKIFWKPTLCILKQMYSIKNSNFSAYCLHKKKGLDHFLWKIFVILIDTKNRYLYIQYLKRFSYNWIHAYFETIVTKNLEYSLPSNKKKLFLCLLKWCKGDFSAFRPGFLYSQLGYTIMFMCAITVR